MSIVFGSSHLNFLHLFDLCKTWNVNAKTWDLDMYPTWTNTCINDTLNTIIMKHFPRYWPFVRGIHRSPVNSPHKGQWRRALMFSLICAWINDWVNNRGAGDLRRYLAHHDVTVMIVFLSFWWLVRWHCHRDETASVGFCNASKVLEYNGLFPSNWILREKSFFDIINL